MSDSVDPKRDPGQPVNRPPGPSVPAPAGRAPGTPTHSRPQAQPPRPKRTSEQIRDDMARQRHELSNSVDHLRDRMTEITDWRGQVKKHRRSIVVGAVATGFVVGGLMALRRR